MHPDTQHNNARHDIQHNIITINNRVTICWVSFILSVVKKPFMRSAVSLFWMSLCWVSRRLVICTTFIGIKQGRKYSPGTNTLAYLSYFEHRTTLFDWGVRCLTYIGIWLGQKYLSPKHASLSILLWRQDDHQHLLMHHPAGLLLRLLRVRRAKHQNGNLFVQWKQV